MTGRRSHGRLSALNGVVHQGSLEVELWRIGDSPPAPRFNVISKPNDWSQSVAQAARAIDDTELSETRVTQRAYWTALHTVLGAAGGPVSGNRKPQPQSWMGYPIGRSGFTLSAVMIRPKNKVRAELYISGEEAKGFLASLKGQRAAIEGELGYHLEWEGMCCNLQKATRAPLVESTRLRLMPPLRTACG